MVEVTFPVTNMDILLQCIPQRRPIVMVDAILSYDEKNIHSALTIPQNGLFITDKRLQEPGIIEHMAQSVALHTGFTYFTKRKHAPTGYIGSISNLSIYHLPKSGDTIQTEVKIIHEFSGVTLVDIYAYAAGDLIAEGQMKTVIAP